MNILDDKTIKLTRLFFLFFCLQTSVLAKDKKPFDFSKYELNNSYNLDCKEKRECFSACRRGAPSLFFLFAFIGSTDPEVKEKIRMGCYNDCARIVCF